VKSDNNSLINFVLLGQSMHMCSHKITRLTTLTVSVAVRASAVKQ